MQGSGMNFYSVTPQIHYGLIKSVDRGISGC